MLNPVSSLRGGCRSSPCPAKTGSTKCVAQHDSAAIAGELWACRLPHCCLQQPCLCPYSNVARTAEADSSATAVEPPRGSWHGTPTLSACDTAAQPVALLQPDVHSLGDADIDLQAQQDSYAEAEVSILWKMVPGCNAALRQACLCAPAHCVLHPAACRLLLALSAHSRLAAGHISAEHNLLRQSCILVSLQLCAVGSCPRGDGRWLMWGRAPSRCSG